MNFHDRFNLLAHALRPYGVPPDLFSDDSDSDEGSDFALNIIFAQAIDAGEITFFPDDKEAPPPRKRRRKGWHKRVKLPYTSSMFYQDYHNKNVQDLSHVDAKEFRLNYRMSWSEVQKIVQLFVDKQWVVSNAGGISRVNVCGRSVCPPEIKILDTLYWLGE